VLLGKIASAHFIENYIYIFAGNQRCANCIGALSFPMGKHDVIHQACNT